MSNSIANYLGNPDDLIYVRVDTSAFDNSVDPEEPFLTINRVADLFKTDIEIIPGTAIVATSEDSQNLLIVTHLLQKLDLDHIVVRVNDPQYIDAYADLSVDLVDVATILGSALAERLDSSSESQ